MDDANILQVRANSADRNFTAAQSVNGDGKISRETDARFKSGDVAFRTQAELLGKLSLRPAL